MRKSFIFFIYLFLLISFQSTAQPLYNSIPLVFKNSAPSIEIIIQNQTIPLLFDLGAAKIELTLNKEILDKLSDIKYTGKFQLMRDSQGRTANLPEFILPEIYLGGRNIKNIHGIETHPFPWGTGNGKPPEDAKNGVIGLGLLQKFNMIIDYKNKKLILFNNNDYPPEYPIDTWPKINFLMEGNIITPLKLGDKTVNLLWDTGSPFNFIKPEIEINGEAKPCSVVDISEFGSDCKKIFSNIIANNYVFGKNIFYIVSMKGLPADGVIGATFFENHIIYINFSEKILAVKPD